jgi:ADP-dependent NAD(P)H-hydrate dehydratase / NAD(P)H-hydrate epimerase
MKMQILDRFASPLWNRDYARQVDNLSSSKFFIEPIVLMEFAGRAVADIVFEAMQEEGTVIILAGAGNNGGDALAAGRHLREAGLDAHFFLIAEGSTKELSELCERQKKILESLGHTISPFEGGCLQKFDKLAPVVIDGILGLGCRSPIAKGSTIFEALCEVAQFEEKKVIAVDIPSGLDVDSGDSQDLPLVADITVTFGGMKPAHVLAPARDLCGLVVCCDIGFPFAAESQAIESVEPIFYHSDSDELLKFDPWSLLPQSSHKFDRGHVLVIGGSEGKTGAPILTALAALRAGAGWASVAMPGRAYESMLGDVPQELTFEHLFVGDQIRTDKMMEFVEERNVKSIVIGPGMIRCPLNQELVLELKKFAERKFGFIVLDAGCTSEVLPILADNALTPDQWILTPHPGEWQKLSKDPLPSPLTAAGYRTVRALCESYGITLLYKSATPVVCHPSSPALICDEGDVTLARAGSGDVFAGILAAHGAQGFSATVGALRSQVVLAKAAHIAAQQVGPHAVLASDIIECIGRIMFTSDDDAESDDDDDDDDDDEEDEDYYEDEN